MASLPNSIRISSSIRKNVPRLIATLCAKVFWQGYHFSCLMWVPSANARKEWIGVGYMIRPILPLHLPSCCGAFASSTLKRMRHLRWSNDYARRRCARRIGSFIETTTSFPLERRHVRLRNGFHHDQRVGDSGMDVAPHADAVCVHTVVPAVDERNGDASDEHQVRTDREHRFSTRGACHR